MECIVCDKERLEGLCTCARHASPILPYEERPPGTIVLRPGESMKQYNKRRGVKKDGKLIQKRGTFPFSSYTDRTTATTGTNAGRPASGKAEQDGTEGGCPTHTDSSNTRTVEKDGHTS